MSRHFETITVGELKAMLDDFHDDLLVVAVSNYGDRANTMQAIALNDLQCGYHLAETAYSNSGYKISDSCYDDVDGRYVLVLNADQFD